MAGARALWVANGMKREQFGKPIIAICNSFTQFVPGHTHLHEAGQIIKQEIERLGCYAAEFNTIAIDDGIAMGLTLNVAVPYVASIERVSERTSRKKIRLCPIFGDIVAYIPRENGGGGLSDEQIEACFELFVRLRDIRDRFVFQKHQKEGNQDGDM